MTQAPSYNDLGSQEDVYEGLKLDALMQKAGPSNARQFDLQEVEEPEGKCVLPVVGPAIWD